MDLATLNTRVTPILVDYPQRSPEWYQARLGNVTGSEAKKVFFEIPEEALLPLYRQILGVERLTPKIKQSEEFEKLIQTNPVELFRSLNLEPPEPKGRLMYRRLKVAERFTGMDAEAGDKFVTQDMKWGIVSERLAIAKYQLETGNIVTEAPFMLHPEIRAGASPDGFVTERSTGLTGVIECKCLRSHNQLYDIVKRKEVPEEYMVQIHMEMWISGRDFCDFIGYDSRLPDGLEMFVKRIPRDDDYIDNVLEPQVRAFLDDCDRDEKHFRALIRTELERRKRDGIILMPEHLQEIIKEAF